LGCLIRLPVFTAPAWLGVGAVLLACLGWAHFVVRHLPPLRGRDRP
jgi:hypothetical protein